LDKDKLQWCRDPNGGTWNKDIPIDTLLIFFQPGDDTGGLSSIGYNYDEPIEHKHIMRIGNSPVASRDFSKLSKLFSKSQT
jgi:hypothetical protein